MSNTEALFKLAYLVDGFLSSEAEGNNGDAKEWKRHINNWMEENDWLQWQQAARAPKAQGVPESFGDIESAVDMLEDYASALANGDLDGAGHSSYQDIHAIADNLKGLVTAPPSDNPGLDCCCGETEEAWRLGRVGGIGAPDMGYGR
ncbi:MAG: hypothetical protein Tp1111DCM1126091_141 [Prokaryotic dsDNA virus sp.]|nr:MAG: hypothetical protein Tp1111DCM1126091_141 [Prokaryotic dsDNA virus sp.]|tara:strand:- start:13078 stop:13518 length:441 start_codon:yes stop_codon:yes gene_type:complete